MLLPVPFQNPAVRTPAAPSYAIAESDFLDLMDQGRTAPPAPPLRGEERLAYRWLVAASAWTAGPLPPDPFPAGSPARQEAQALRRLLSGALPAPEAVAKAPLALGGSRLLLWRWMKAKERKAPLPLPLRHALEDRLIGPGPGIIRGWALRHALCFALAERDQARYTALHDARAVEARFLLRGFQAAFALLDGPSPVFRLWRLPELDFRDTSFGGLGARRVWVAPLDLPPASPDTAWILPSATGELGDREAALAGKVKAEGQDLAGKLRAKGRSAWFAASGGEWEELGLTFFPILLDLDAQGAITSIRMGDAAPERP